MSIVCKQGDTNFTKTYNLRQHQLTYYQQNKDVNNKFLSI